MKNSIKLPLLAIPALAVTTISLTVLLVTFAAAASQGGDSPLSLQAPAIQVPFLLTNDNAPAKNPVTAPKPSITGPLAPSVKTDARPNDTPLSTSNDDSSRTSIKTSDDGGGKEIENEAEHENETEKDSEASGHDSESHDSGGSDNSSGSHKGK